MKHGIGRRLLSIVLSVMMLVSLLPTTAFADGLTGNSTETTVKEDVKLADSEKSSEDGGEDTNVGNGGNDVGNNATAVNNSSDDEADKGENEVAPQAAATTAVAKIGETEYATLQEAINAATTDETVTLLQNVDLGSEKIGFYNGDNTNLTFDLNGHTITTKTTGPSGYAVAVAKDGLVIKNGTISNTSESTNLRSCAVYVTSAGTTTFENVKLTATGSGIYASVNKGEAVINVGNDTEISGVYGVYLNGTENKSSYSGAKILNVTGGKITGTTAGVCVVGPGTKCNAAAATTVNISGGEVNSITTKYSSSSRPADIAISGGTVTGALTNNGSDTVTITGGTFNGTLSNTGSGTISVTGGTFTATDVSKYVQAGYKYDSTTGEVKQAEPTGVAKIGDTGYETLAAAVRAANAGDTIVLLDDINLDSYQTISKQLTIDLNGKTITSTAINTIRLTSNADLTVKDSAGGGKITNTNSTDNARTVYLYQYSNMTFTLESGTIESTPNVTSIFSRAIDNQSGKTCKVNIKGGSVTVPEAATEGRGIVAGKGMTLNISGGTITGGLHGVDAYSGSNVTITGGTISARIADTGVIKEAYGMRITGTANVTVDGGEITGVKMDDNGYKLDVPNVTLKSGKINGSFYSVTNGTITFTVDDNATITFGNDSARKFLPNTVKLVQNEDGSYGVKAAAAKVAQIGTVTYETLADAIAAAKDGETVTLLADITLEGQQLVIGAGKSFTLDLNGKTLKVSKYTAKAAQVDVLGDLTLTDSSENKTGIICSDYTGTAGLVVCVESGGKLTMNGGTITTDGMAQAGNALKIASGATVIMNAGTIKCDAKRSNRAVNITGSKTAGASFTMNGGSVVADEGDGTETAIYAIMGSAYSTLVISGNSQVSGPNAVTTSTMATSTTTISGGTFTGNISVKAGSISGGTYDKAIDAKYCKDGFIPTRNEDGSYGVKPGTYVAEVNGTKYESLAAAIAAAENGTVKLLTDVEQNSCLVINKDITLDLNGKKIENTEDIWSDTAVSLISINSGAKVTITGNGTIKAKDNDCYTFNVVNGDLGIENGTFVGNVSVVQVQTGSLEIKGGKFSLAQKWEGKNTYLINCIDDNFADGTAKVAISGGTFEDFDPNVSPEKEVNGKAPSFAAPGVGITKNDDGTFTAEADMVAQIIAADGSSVKAYNVLAAAIAAAEAGQTVTLLTDLDLSATGLTIAKNKDVTLDLNGKTLKLANTDFGNIRVEGKLTLKDSTDTAKNGTGTGKVWTETPYIYGSQDKVMIAAIDGGTFIMESGLIDAASFTTDNANKGQFAVSVQNENADATVIINGGCIKAGWYAIAGNGQNTTYNGNITVNGGILESTADYAIYHPHSGTTTINGGVVFGAAGGISLNRGKLIVNDGVITSKGTGTTGDWGDGTGNQSAAAINVNAQYGSTSVEIKGGKITAENDAILLTNGKDGTISVSGGTFSSAVKEEYCATGYIPTANADGTYGVKAGAYVAQIEKGAKYETLQEAINAAGFDKKVYLLTDLTVSDTVEIPAGKNITLYLNNHTLTVENGHALRNYGKLYIQRGKVVSKTGAAVALGGDGVAKLYTYASTELEGREGAIITGEATGAVIDIRGGTYTATDNAVIAGNGSKRDGNPNKITITKGTFNGSITSTGYIACGIYAPWNDNVIVSGGTFNITDGAGIVARAGTVKVTGGTFICGDGQTTGWVGDSKNMVPCAALVFDKAANYPALTTDSKILVSGGSFSTDPSLNGTTLAAGYEAKQNEAGMYTLVSVDPVATVNGVNYGTLDKAIAAAEAAAEKGNEYHVILVKDIDDANTNYTVKGKVTIDLNGHDITGSGSNGVFYVTTKGDLTITGNGTITAVESSKSAMAVYVWSTAAKVTLAGGTYRQRTTSASDHFDLIYVGLGTVEVTGGKYEGATPKWTLNCEDKNYQNGADIIVTGGTFKSFDPSANPEGKGTTYVKTGYVSTANGDGTYTVREANYEAVIDDTTYYEDVDEALTYWATNGGTLKLLADCTTDAGASGNWYFNVQKTATLDLNGKTLTLGANKYIGTPYDENNPQTLTIQDSAEGGKLVGTYFYVIQGSWSTTVIVNSGEICNTNNKGALLNNGPVVVNGGKLTGGTYGVSTNSDFTMTKGEINILALNARVETAELGTVDGVYTDVKIGTLTVRGDATTVNFNSGIVDTFSTGDSPTLNTTENAYFVNAFTKGLPSGKMLKAVEKDGANYYQLADLTEADAAAKVTAADGTETLYADAGTAASALRAGGTLTLLQDHNGDTLRVNKVGAGSVTIDLNGKTVTNSNGPALYIVINGDSDDTEPYTVTVKGTGTLKSENNVALRVSAVNKAADVAVDDNVTLTAGGANAAIDLQNAARLVYTDEATAQAQIGNGYVVTVDGKNYAFGISGGFVYAVKQLPAAGGTVKLLDDYAGFQKLSYTNDTGKPVVLDLNGKTYSYTSEGGTAALEFARPNSNLTVKNGTIKSASEYVVYGVLTAGYPSSSANDLKLTLDGVKLIGTKSGFGVNGTLTGNETVIKNSTIEAADTGIYYPTAGTLTIENSTINGTKLGVAVKGGTVNISGDETKISATANAKEPTNYYGGGKGAIEAEGYALYVEGGYSYDITLNISGGTFESKGDAIKKFVKDGDTQATRTIAVSGGNFSSKVLEDFCAPGYVPTEADKNGYYTVAVKSDVVAVIGTKEYATLNEALMAAQEDETVTLLKDTTEYAVIVRAGSTLDLNGNSVTGAQVVVANGQIVDTGDVKGIVQAEAYAMQGNKYTPVYDSKRGGYSFFDLSVTMKVKDMTDGTRRAAFYMDGANSEVKSAADLMLGDSTNRRVKAYLTFTWRIDDQKNGNQTFTFTDVAMNSYLANAENYWLYVKTAGADALDSVQVQATFEITGAAGNQLYTLSSDLRAFE